jgi:hypothetical protein
MNTRTAQRRRAGPMRPAPEWIGAGMVVVLYAAVLGAGPLLLSAATSTPETETPGPSASASPAPPSTDPLAPAIAAILEINERLTHAGEELKDIIGRRPFRGSEAAFVFRRIKNTLLSSADRVAVLARDRRTPEAAAQLEILYANADAAVEQASDLALGNDREYRDAAAHIVDLFRDLTIIDDQLRAVLVNGVQTPSPGASPSAIAVASPSGAVASPSGSPGPVATSSASIASPDPSEMLRDPGFETGLGSWTRRATGGASLPATSAAEPLGSKGAQSLRVDVPATGSLAMVSIGQGPIALKAGSRYVARIIIRTDTVRSAQLRVVGPAEETYGILLVEVGPATVEARLEFLAVLDQPNATLWIDLGGSNRGSVWLDDASLTAVTPP